MKRIFCALLALVTAIFASSCSQASTPVAADEGSAKLLVHFLDVGQGDSILLESDDEFVLIDGGERDCGDQVLRYIEDRGADELKYMIATHPHADHIGGLRPVVNGIEVENFITKSADCDTYSWTKLLRAVENNHVNTIEAQADDTYSFGSAELTVLAPLSVYPEDYNNASIVVMVTCGSIRFLLTGDAGRESEYEMLDRGEELSADVLKCGHHGSSDSTSDRFLKAVNPSFAVVSCGADNDYGHPHRETVQKLKTLGCPLLRTDETGTITAYTDGTHLRFSAENADLSVYTYTVGDTKNDTSALGYIGNKNSGYFHYSDCDGAQSMKEKNKVFFDNREDAVDAGYTPCPNCQP
ncbi:MAG: MBL fold metallo-hydrolase [Ruminococcus sp.]|nr:MBL fold metallo-hydrolase [Ruminococcus sp.]